MEKNTIMERVAIGFLFSEDRNYVALINQLFNESRFIKNNGVYLNGIGGHVEQGENSLSAVRREYIEEAGVDIETWKQFCSLYTTDLQVDFFNAFSSKVFDVKTLEDETISVYHINQLQYLSCHPNLATLIGMCFDDLLHIGTLVYL